MAELKEVIISQEQAREFARQIYADIEDYIENHREEFKQFLEQENNLKEDLK